MRSGNLQTVEIVSKFFWDRVKKRDDGCWEWTGNYDRYGVPQARRTDDATGKSKRGSARRMAWNLIVDPEETGAITMCKNLRGCVNPEHLSVQPSRGNDLTDAEVENLRRNLVRYLNGNGRGSPRRKVSMY